MTDKPPSRERLRGSLRALLAKSDLATTTERGLRKALQAEFDADLSQYKDFIRAEVTAYLEADIETEAGETAQEDAELEEPPKKKRKAGGGFGTCRLSQPLSDFLQEEQLARSEVVKRIWAYIKEHDLQNPKDKRKIVLDDALAKIFKAPLTMFSMNKQLSKHCFSAGSSNAEVKDGNEGEEELLQKVNKPSKPKRTYPADVPEAAQDPADTSGSSIKAVAVSQELADLLGLSEPKISQQEAISRFYEYAKVHNLRDPENESFFLPDAAMMKLTGPDRIPAKLTAVSQLLSQHILS